MSVSPHPHRALVTGLALAIVLDTAVQLFWKFAVAGLPETATPAAAVMAVLRQPWFLLVAGLFIAQLLNWLKVLERADLSFAQPITSLSYVSVCLLSAWFFGECISVAKIAGVGCILAGVWLISRGEARASPSGSKPARADAG
ncbi:hypothetical protein BH11PSE8_BH11PSE8_14310 [soil metagenome]